MIISLNKNFFFVTIVASLVLLGSCSRDSIPVEAKANPSSYSSDVVDKWMTMQLRLMRNATGIANHAFSRHFSYSGIAALEALKPGFNAQPGWTARWNGLTGLPVAGPSNNYYYPANVNAALAAMNRAMFPNASAADKAAIDSLEESLNLSFLLFESAEVLTVSSSYGKAVASAVFNWSETDGYKNANNPYTPPVGPGLWKPTPPAFGNPATPYWRNNRPILTGSTQDAQPEFSILYAENEHSAFFQMAHEVYTASLGLTNEQKAMAMFWRDVPGVSSPGHWLSILQQVIRIDGTKLDKAALAYALTGSAINDALIACFETKYTQNLVRPVTYIREVMGYTNWSPFLGTPAHPEFPSAHSSLSAAAASVMEKLFGNTNSFTDHTYDYLGFAPRTYSSYSAIAIEAGKSRLYAGIHYKPGIDAGLWQGRKVAENIFTKHSWQAGTR